MDGKQLLAELQSGNITDLKIEGNCVEDWPTLVHAAQGCAFRSITMANVKLTGPAEAALVQMLGEHALKSVALENLQLSTTTTRVIANAVPWSNLESLSLAQNGSLGPRGIKLWCEYLKQASRLYNFDCQGCGMGHFGAQAVGQVLPTSLLSLNMAQNKLGADGIWKMANRLQELTVLQTLDLSQNQMGDDGCLEMARNLSSSTNLETLLLRGNAIADTGIGELVRILPQLEHLRTLDLSDNKLGNFGAKKIGAALGTCGSLEVLNLSGNSIADSGCAALVEGLLPPDEDESEEDSESEDEYFECEDGEEDERHQHAKHAMGSFEEAPKRKESRLRELRLDHNEIGDEGAGSFVEHLDQIVSLQTVKLDGNQISDARMRILDMLLKHRTTIASPKKTFNPETSFSVSDRDEEILPIEVTPVETSPENEAKEISEGRDIILSMSSEDEDHMTKLPMGYITHVTNQWSNFVFKHGAFGPLFRAVDEETEDDESLRLVRRLDLSPAGKMEVVREAVLEEIPKLHHRYIAPLMATSMSQGTYVFMYDIPDASSLPLTKCLAEVEHRKALTWSIRLHLACCISEAVEFLHKETGARKAALHGDLHPDAVYVSHDYQHVFLLDAGMSRLLATDRTKFAQGGVVYGTRGYRCPRYERGSVAYDSASDIFSLGILLAELITSRLQKSRESKNDMGFDVYYDTYLARKPIRTDPLAGPVTKPLAQNLGKLILACMNPLPMQRPTASTVAQILKETTKLHESSVTNK